MDRSTREVPGEAGSALFLGPGARLATLRPILAALSDPARTVRAVEPLDALADLEGDGGTLLLDADLLAVEDLGWLRRLCASRPALRLVLVGDDPSRRGARSLLRLAQARWTSWPPDVEDLEAIAGAAHAIVPPRAVAAEAPPRMRRASIDDEISDIEAILEMPPTAERIATHERPRETQRAEPAAPLPSVERSTAAGLRSARPGDRDDPTAERSAIERAPLFSAAPHAPAQPRDVAQPRDATPRPPKYFRDQVADLADIAQRIELGIEAAEEAQGALSGDRTGGAGLDELRGEVARLVQFTRTLGYLVAPPPPGEQVFDLGEMIRVIVAGLVAHGPESPRCLLRGNGPLLVRSDRQLLGQAFDALFFLVQFAARTGEVVRVQWAAEDSPALARIMIEFPPGPLGALTPAQIVEPYGLRRMLPELGANALSAAIGIVEGQGGQAQLRRTHAGRLEWVVTLPLHVEARHNGSPASDPHRDDATSLARPEDPFA